MPLWEEYDDSYRQQLYQMCKEEVEAEKNEK